MPKKFTCIAIVGIVVAILIVTGVAVTVPLVIIRNKLNDAVNDLLNGFNSSISDGGSSSGPSGTTSTVAVPMATGAAMLTQHGLVNLASATNFGYYVQPANVTSGVTGIHQQLMMNTSKVVFTERWDAQGTKLKNANGTSIWSTEFDYTTDTYRPLTLVTNVFCGSGALLPDSQARIIMIGGAEYDSSEVGTLLNGENLLRFMSPSGSPGVFGTTDWDEQPNNPKFQINKERWYPTTVMLPTGNLLVVGGNDGGMEFNAQPNNTASIEFVPPVPGWQKEYGLQFLWDTMPINLYPEVYVLPSGRVFAFASDRSTLLDPLINYRELRTWTVSPTAAPATCLTAATAGIQTSGCNNLNSLNQNATASSPQTFAFLVSNSTGLSQIYSSGTRKCLARTMGDTGIIMAPCNSSDAAQQYLISTTSPTISIQTPTMKTCLSTNGMTFINCASSDATQMFRLTDPNIYFEFPRLPGGPYRSYPYTGFGNLLPLDPSKDYEATVMVCGGSDNQLGPANLTVAVTTAVGLNTCGTIKPDSPDATWDMSDTMPSGRVLGDLIHLPDGTMLAINGAQNGMAGFDLGRNPNFHAIIYDRTRPAGSRWIVGNSTTIPRLYHSSAILLPDGRILVAGSAPNNPYALTGQEMYHNEIRVEYYYPHYLTSGKPAPVIAPLASTEWSYGAAYPVSVATNSTSQVQFNVIQPGFRTHSTGMSQRLVWLVSSASGGAYIVNAPPNANVAPPGWYLLFAVVDGMPSVAKWLRLGGDPAGFGTYYAGF
ncbi:hypothetical protein HK101_008821 [Irineochytrium annulatum]|nr:hypothetical protein HK101_008821 [Irineochytrium annulatum]